ncbi:DUF302 domain-containing protein [Halegenticoccus soli]|uniref:DUF302 domain-containing protein n=1 Tax=Halegenticoccus soli TaxID=1985678 RepID=UPI000C6EB94E|nr:DUF302 domain-containing protein [Halegenticoccus soli]
MLEDRRTFVRLAGVALGLAGAGTAVAGGDDGSGDESDGHSDDGSDDRSGDGASGLGGECALEGVGLETVESDECFGATVDRITGAIEGNENLALLATIDHAANAESVGQDLRPTTLLLFGNPEVGTPLMQESPTAGIDLPQKLLVWEDDDGSVKVTYNDPEFLAERHGIDGQDERIGMVSSALKALASGEVDE